MATNQNYVYPSSAEVSVAAIGPNGQPIPSQSILVAGENPSGDLQPLQTDSSGDLLVSISGFPASVLNVNLAEVGGVATSLGQKASAASIPVVIASDQSAVAITAASLPLPTGAATSANQTNASQKTQIVDGSGNVIGSTSNALNVNVENTIPISGTVTVDQGTSPWVDNISQFGGNNVVTGTGASGVGIPRVTVSNDSNILASQSGTWTVQPGNTPNTAPWLITINEGGNSAAVTGANALKVDGSASTQPVSGTVTANQGGAPWSQNLTEVGGSAIALGQAVMAASVPVVIASNQTTVPVSSSASGTASANAPVYNAYSSTNITTSAYTQLVASTSNVINTIHIFDSSGQAMILAVGASGLEVVQLYVPPGGDTYTLNIPAGSRIAYKALTANATSGYLLMSFLE